MPQTNSLTYTGISVRIWQPLQFRAGRLHNVACELLTDTELVISASANEPTVRWTARCCHCWPEAAGQLPPDGRGAHDRSYLGAGDPDEDDRGQPGQRAMHDGSVPDDRSGVDMQRRAQVCPDRTTAGSVMHKNFHMCFGGYPKPPSCRRSGMIDDPLRRHGFNASTFAARVVNLD